MQPWSGEVKGTGWVGRSEAGTLLPRLEPGPEVGCPTGAALVPKCVRCVLLGLRPRVVLGLSTRILCREARSSGL